MDNFLCLCILFHLDQVRIMKFLHTINCVRWVILQKHVAGDTYFWLYIPLNIPMILSLSSTQTDMIELVIYISNEYNIVINYHSWFF